MHGGVARDMLYVFIEAIKRTYTNRRRDSLDGKTKNHEYCADLKRKKNG